jgi:hypothetical protein
MGVRWWRKYVSTKGHRHPQPYGAYPDYLLFMAQVGAATAAAPFLQAVATHFGNRFATGLDNSARRALRRFLRRELRRQNALSSDRARKIKLRTSDGSAMVVPAATTRVNSRSCRETP